MRERLRHTLCSRALVLVAVGACAPAAERTRDPAIAASEVGLPDAVSLTWLSVTNWLLEAGETRILFDGYVTRLDRRIVNADGTSNAPATIDRTTLARIAEAVIPDRRLDWVLVGHGHWDHAWDAPGWAVLTSARVGGSRTVCHQAVAFGVSADRCTAVEGGEVIEIGSAVRVRVVRWHHSGDSTTNGRRLRAPLELRAPPRAGAGANGVRPGFVEDYPNGGGSRAYLVTVRTRGGPVTLFWSNTGNPQAWDAVVPIDSTELRGQGLDLSHLEWAPSSEPTRDALIKAMRAEGITSVNVWLGWAGAAHVRQVVNVLRPAAFIPHHWDDFWEPIFLGVRRPYSAPSVTEVLAANDIRSLAPVNYFDRFRLTTRGLTTDGDGGIRAKLGVPAAPPGR